MWKESAVGWIPERTRGRAAFGVASDMPAILPAPLGNPSSPSELVRCGQNRKDGDWRTRTVHG
ncbi:hypothetical protein Ais01nite_28100 [Asanoa ishikariensis]|nr:hypothetical protein Ais01nite_28100 [Asanoa ishikariensis]